MKGISKVLFLTSLLPLIVIAAAPELPGHAGISSTAARPTPLFAAPTRFDRVGRIIAPVMVDGQGPFRFLVDTGANGSMISQRLALRLRLTPGLGAGEHVEGTTGNENMPWVTLSQLRVGRIVKSNLRVPVSQSPVLGGLDGILGLAGFGSVQIAVDFRRKKVTISPSYGRIWGWGFLEISAQRTPGGLLMIPARVANVSVEAVIDTGASETLGNSALRSALTSAKEAAAARIYGVTRKVAKASLFSSPTIYLGPAAIRHLSIAYSDVPIFGLWHLESRPALIIGMNVLDAVDEMILDYAHARIYLRPASPGSHTIQEQNIYSPSIIRGH